MAGPLSIDQFRQFNVHCLQSGILIESCQGIITCLKKKAPWIYCCSSYVCPWQMSKKGGRYGWLHDSGMQNWFTSKFQSENTLPSTCRFPWKNHGKPTSCQYLITLWKLPYSAVGPAPSPNNYNLTVFFNFRGAEGENKYNLVAKKAPVGSFSCKKKWPRTNLVATKAPVD